MKATDLRLGNLIKKNNKIYEISSLFFVDLYDGTIRENYNNSYVIEPIQLTEEWLLKFGFEKTMSWTYVKDLVGNLQLVYYLGEKGWSIGFNSYSDFSNLKYVHQIQNLYFALTGKELTLNK
jgi:hypothetical protein